MKSLQMALFISLLSHLGFSQQNPKAACTWPEVKPLEQGSAVSTYTFHYWDYVKKSFGKYIPEKLHKTGTVVGDFHFNNVAIYFSEQQKSVQFAIADLDDAGTAPLLADYAKYVISLKEKYKKINLKPVLASYVNGLKGTPPLLIPPPVKQLINQKKSYFDQMNADYVLRKLNKDQDQFEKKYPLEKMKHLNEPYKSLAIQTEKNLQKTMNVLDSGFKYNNSGSSLDLLRIQYLVNYQGSFQILELKQTRCAGTELYQNQLPITNRYALVLPIFKSEEYWKNTRIVPFYNDQFIFRTKLANALETLEIDKMSSQQGQAYSEYFAFLLGQLHASQADGAFVQGIESHLDSIQNAIDQFSTEYLIQLKNDMKNNVRFL